MQKSRIDWGVGQLYTFNPVTGCPRNCSFGGKPYCYARRIHERFYKTPFSDVVFHPKRLKDAMPKKPSHIFVGSMTDCAFWKRNMWSDILEVCRNNPQHTFMFLSKDVTAYYGLAFPSNCMQGLTITKANKPQREEAFWMGELAEYFNRPFLSIEPLLGPVNVKIPEKFELVIVGAMTGPGATAPEKAWVDSIKANVSLKQLFWKSSMEKYR